MLLTYIKYVFSCFKELNWCRKEDSRWASIKNPWQLKITYTRSKWIESTCEWAVVPCMLGWWQTLLQQTSPQFILHPCLLHWWNYNYTCMKNQYTTLSCTKSHSNQMLVLANARQSYVWIWYVWCVLPGLNYGYKCDYCEIIWALHKFLFFFPK